MKNSRTLQRHRRDALTRKLCDENSFNLSQLIQPLFVVEGLKGREEIQGLRGTDRLNLDLTLAQIEADLNAGVTQFLLFNVPKQKSDHEPQAGHSAKTIESIKKQFGDSLSLWVDTCLCSFTSSGHCCFFKDKKIDSERTLNALSQLALTYAKAGANGISPSDMMDGRTRAIRAILDAHGFSEIPIMCYSTKFASSFFGPFRNAASSTPQFGDRRSYQIDVKNRSDAIRSSLRCAEEGADFLMVKPGMTSIDLISEIQQRTDLPVGAYQVSGEYAGMHFLDQNNVGSFEDLLLESWSVFKRAGAQFIISYGSRFGKELGVAS